jgi:phospholipase D3/4
VEGDVTADASPARAYLVESIPMGLEDLTGVREVHTTGEVLTRLARAARKTIDVTAMYWNLKPNPEREDERGFTVAQLESEFGAGAGRALYEAVRDAARRGVAVRIVESPGFGSPDDESRALQAEFPAGVDIRRIDLGDWYDGGIMHQKLWVFDGAHVYLGSANNDWKSLTQVKELGVAVEQSPPVAEAVTRYFETWWEFCGLAPQRRSGVVDPVARIARAVPAWSSLVPGVERAPNPLDRSGLHANHDWDHPLPFVANGQRAEWILAGSPAELCVGGRVPDIEALVRTIAEADERVCINVMDFAPVSLYRGAWDSATRSYRIGDAPATPVWWPPLFDAIVHAVTTRALHVRLLVSEWEHTSPFVGPYLEALRAATTAGASHPGMTAGRLEVRRFRVPGWERTEAGVTPRAYPGHTRVNHTKYIVTDRRVNIGTSNMTWDYFAGTAGASFNTTHPDLVTGLQALFDRDWQSAYAAG